MDITTAAFEAAPTAAENSVPAVIEGVASACGSWVGHVIPTVVGIGLEAYRKRELPKILKSAVHAGVDQFTHLGVKVAVRKALWRFGGWLAKRWLALAFASQPIVVLSICVGISVAVALLA
jgi:hypothetical protein